MAGEEAKVDPPNVRKYGVPLYACGWVPSNKFIRSKNNDDDDDKEHNYSSSEYYVILSGGGGEGRSGIPNEVLISRFDPLSNSLSPQPVSRLKLGSDLPYRMAVHPGGDGIVCAFPKFCRYYEWDEFNKDGKSGKKSSEKVLTQLQDIDQQLALSFDPDSSVLAVGGEEGDLRVFKWPGMESIINVTKAHGSFKDLQFSPDGKYLVTLGSGDTGRVWDVASSKAVASLPKEKDEIFTSCRFSQMSDNTQVLYVAARIGNGVRILTWSTSSWKKMSSKFIKNHLISSFDVSPDGKLFAIGTVDGHVVLVSATNLQVHTEIKKAHLGMVTTLSFSKDSRALVSASMDSSARVTLVEDKKSSEKTGWLTSGMFVLLVVLLAIATYFLKKWTTSSSP